MTNIDQFESVFKSALKDVFSYEPVEIRTVQVITDLEEGPAKAFADRTRAFLKVLETDPPPEWEVIFGERFTTVSDLLEVVRGDVSNLICTYRNLHSTAWQWPHSLGSHLDVLTQATRCPVLVLPHPKAKGADNAISGDTHNVMAITDHLAGDQRLVNMAAAMTFRNGTLFLSHVEDQKTFDRYADIISKLPEVNTDDATAAIRLQLLKEPHDYIRSCREVLEENQLPLTVEEMVTMGHHLADYQTLIEQHDVGLLVMNTKDEDQMAMHGLAYSLAVELRRIPMLLL